VTTKSAGGVIRGPLAITCEAQYAAVVGDPVMIGAANYEVLKCDGSKPVIGQVSAITKAVPSTGGDRTTVNPGDVTVEARGYSVLTFKSGGALATPGIIVGINSAGKIAAAGGSVSSLGILLTTATAVDLDVDVLVGPTA
jgi:hypothetical protein